jgi:hypothetical protein
MRDNCNVLGSNPDGFPKSFASCLPKYQIKESLKNLPLGVAWAVVCSLLFLASSRTHVVMLAACLNIHNISIRYLEVSRGIFLARNRHPEDIQLVGGA